MVRNLNAHSLFLGLRCYKCGALHPLGASYCRKDRGLLLSDYQLSKEAGAIQFHTEEMGVWRFLPMLPPLPRRLSRGEGNTPLLASRKLGDTLGIDLFFKDEGANPSGSFKDRGVVVMASALDPSAETVIMMSSGNAASSVALYSALAGVHAVVLMYQGGTRAKAFMTRSYGATVFAVQAEREADVLTLAETVAKEKGWPLMNTVAAGNPLILDGYKTLAYELVEALADIDATIVPVGSGTLISGIWKGFDELHRAGMISHVPRLIGVQPTGSCPIVKAFEAGLEQVPPLAEAPHTVAAALTLDDPGATGTLTLHAIRTSKGTLIAVDDDTILSACQSLALDETILVEPAAAVGVAALTEAIEYGVIQKGERVVCVLTGHGLKDIESVERSMPPMINIAAEKSEFMDAYASIERKY
ncbi:threonine synthase [Candidatus Bipolaricaulota bacterium]|nr:threonine synthase [Candidatus Bipolaricaulota bacterium]